MAIWVRDQPRGPTVRGRNRALREGIEVESLVELRQVTLDRRDKEFGGKRLACSVARRVRMRQVIDQYSPQE